MNESRRSISRKKFLQMSGLSALSLFSLSSAQNSGERWNPVLGFADEAGRPRRPLWVRQVAEPTIQVNWDQVKRFDARDAVLGDGENLADFIGEKQAEAAMERMDALRKERVSADIPGFSLQDYALLDAQITDVYDNSSLLGPVVQTPQERGVSPFQGTADEAARTIRVAMRMFGAAQVGFVELTEQTRKLIFSFDRDGKEIVFEDVDRAMETETQRIIPNKARWVIAYTVRMSIENMKYAPSIISTQDSFNGYNRGRYIQNHTQAFISSLGYQCIGQVPLNGLGITPAFSVLAGQGEMSRLNRMITPEYGPMVRTFMLLTDLPVSVDQPIDAGILSFCKTCKKCAESCPASALSRSDDPGGTPLGKWNSTGHQAYYEDSVRCLRYWYEEAGCDCSICFSVCPFSKKDRAWVHALAKTSISRAPGLDGFIRSLDDALSYGAQRNLEQWWHLDFPEHGLDPEQRKG